MTRNTPARTDDRPAAPARTDDTVMHRLARQVDPLKRILGGEDTARRLIQLTMIEVRKNPDLLECSPESIVGALALCAQYDLEPGPQQHVYLIPRWNSKVRQKEATWQLGYLGMVELAARASVGLVADVVRENDHWRYWRTTEADHIEHRRAAGPRGAVVRAYAIARFPDGRPPLVEVCELDEIHAARDRSEQPDRAWKSDFAAMARKTPVRRIFKWIGVSTLRHAHRDDGSVQRVPVENMPADMPAVGAASAGNGDGDGGRGLPAGAYEIDDAPELRPLDPGQHAQLNGWGVDDDLRHALVAIATGGRTESSQALTHREQGDFMALAEAFADGVFTLDNNGDMVGESGEPVAAADVLGPVDGEIVDDGEGDE